MKTIRIVHWAVFDVVDNILENGVPAMDLFNALNPKYKLHGTWALPYGHGVDAMWADYAREKQRHRNSVKPDSFAIQVVADIPISDVQIIKDGRITKMSFDKQMDEILYTVCDADNGFVLKNGIPMGAIRRIAMVCNTKEKYAELYRESMRLGMKVPHVSNAWGITHASFESGNIIVSYDIENGSFCQETFKLQKFEVLYEG